MEMGLKSSIPPCCKTKNKQLRADSAETASYKAKACRMAKEQNSLSFAIFCFTDQCPVSAGHVAVDDICSYE